MKLKFVNTDTGNRILADLQSEGWKIISEYGANMFDKGIDYDFYSLKKAKKYLDFEWDNWFEWEIAGDVEKIRQLSWKYELKLFQD